MCARRAEEIARGLPSSNQNVTDRDRLALRNTRQGYAVTGKNLTVQSDLHTLDSCPALRLYGSGMKHPTAKNKTQHSSEANRFHCHAFREFVI
jgi:hypothetical protein